MLLEPDELIGLRLGRFTIHEILGEGFEVVAYSLRDSAQGYLPRFVLKLAHSNPIWRLTEPPRLGTFSNVTDQTRAVSGTYRVRNTRIAEAALIPSYYGLYRDRFLIPVAEVRRLRGDTDVDTLLERTSNIDVPNAIGSVRLVNMLAGLLLRAAISGDLSIDAWHSNAGRWFAGRALQVVISEERIGSDLSDDARSSMMSWASDSTRSEDVPDLADNILIRLFAARQEGWLDATSFWATLQSKHFRYNVSDEELFQISAAEALLRSSAGMPGMRGLAEKSLGNLSVLRESIRDVNARTEEQGEFRAAEYVEGRLDEFQLLLQERL